MAVTIEEVRHVAQLARLSFSEAEQQKLTTQLNTILEYMEELNSINTDAVEPLFHVIDLKNVLRDDVCRPGLSRDEALRNAPERNDQFFKVPKVIRDR